MEVIKKEGSNIKKLVTLLWFVFCALSFLFFIKTTSYAGEGIKTYKYVFDIGDAKIAGEKVGNTGTQAIDLDLKLTYYVEENTDKSVTDRNRYKILQKEITGYFDGYSAKKYAKKFSDYTNIDLNKDSDLNIYNFLQYVAFTTSKETNPNSRKLMKAFLFAMLDDNMQILVEENGERNYVWYDVDAQGNNITRDDDFKEFVWLYDRKLVDRNFYGLFNDYFINNNTKTIYNSEYAADSMTIEIDGAHAKISSMLGDDITLFILMNKEIENNGTLGQYFKTIKIATENEIYNEDNLTWWIKKFDEKSSTAIISVGPNTNTEVFSFKYSFKDDLRMKSDKTKISPYVYQGVYDYEYTYNTKIANFDDQIDIYPIVYNGKQGGFELYFEKDSNGNDVSICPNMYFATNTLSRAQTGEDYIQIGLFKKENIYKTNAYKEHDAVELRILGKKVTTIRVNDIKEKCNVKTVSNISKKENNGYTFELDKAKKEIHFYKTGDTSYSGMNLKIDQRYNLFVDAKERQYGLALKADPFSKDGDQFITIGVTLNDTVQKRLPTLISNNPVRDEEGEEFSFEWDNSKRNKTMFFWANVDSTNDIILAIYDLSNISDATRGAGKGETIKLNKCKVIAQVSILDWLRELEAVEWERGIEGVNRAKLKGTILGDIITGEKMDERLTNFFDILGEYSKPLVMFLIFIAIVVAAVSAIMDSNDPQKRVILAQRIKNIIAGALIFSVCFLIISIATHYFSESMDLLTQGSDLTYNYEIDSDFNLDQNWLINLVEKIILAVGKTIEWVINYLASRLLLLDARELDLSSAIFGVTSGGGITLYPFSDIEWRTFMSGYKMLSFLTIALMAIAFIKNAIMLVINAGNSEKISMVKNDYLRAIAAILAIILAPYGIRLLITLTNALVQLIPISESKFDLSFEGYGFIGSIAFLVYNITELKIYVAFIVRKLMIIFLLIATPFVFGAWTLSTKIRSFQLWIGELLTNIFMQLAYAFAFFFLVIVLANEENPFAVLLLVTMLIKLADFVKDSLQGLYSQWGGINETQIADQAVGKTVDLGKTIVKDAEKPLDVVGKGLVNYSEMIDPKAITKRGRFLYNAGKIASRNFSDVRTKKDMKQNLLAEYEDEKRKSANDAKDKFNEFKRSLGKNGGTNKALQEMYDKYISGELSAKDVEKLSEQAKEFKKKYDKMDSDQRAKYRGMDLDEIKANGLYGEDFDKLKDFIEARNEERMYSHSIEELKADIKNTKGILSTLQGNATEAFVDKYLDKNIGSVVDSSEDIIDEKLKEYSKLSEELNLNENLDEKTYNDRLENYEENKAKIIALMKDIIEENYRLSLLAATTYIKPKHAPHIVSMTLSQELAQKYGDYDVTRSQMIEDTINNMKQFEANKDKIDPNQDKTNKYMSKSGSASMATRKREGYDTRTPEERAADYPKDSKDVKKFTGRKK